MKIISLNLAGRDNFGQDFNQRMMKIAQLLDQEQADVVCFQEIYFDQGGSLADKINAMLKTPYDFIDSVMSEKFAYDEWSDNMKKKWSSGLIESDGEYLTDGLAILSRHVIKNHEVLGLKSVPTDERGRPDFRKRIAQNVEIDTGLKISNVHFASNNNAYMQLKELVLTIDERLIVGDYNMTKKMLHEHKNIWGNRFNESTEYLDYVSYQKEGVAYDHLLLPKSYRFISIRVADGLSDHSAVIYEIKKALSDQIFCNGKSKVKTIT